VLGYRCCAWQEDRGIVMQYGCETHLLDEWPALLPALCTRHVQGRESEYTRAITAWMELVRVALTEPTP
jgi:hypothetical protein